MKRVEVASLDDRDLIVKEYELGRELASTRFRHALGQFENSSEIRVLRRGRARLKTEVRRREIENGLTKDELYQRHASALRSLDSEGADSAAASDADGGGGILGKLRRRLGGSDEA